jgi:hypothetical protein
MSRQSPVLEGQLECGAQHSESFAKVLHDDAAAAIEPDCPASGAGDVRLPGPHGVGMLRHKEATAAVCDC